MRAQWNAKPIGEVLRLEYGKPLEDTDRKPDGLYPVYGANGEKDRSDRFYFDRPSIIVGRKGSAGEVNLTEERFWPLDVTYFVTFDERQHELRFLYYLLTTLDLPGLAKGVKPGINRNEVYSQVTTIPPLPEQQRIVGILDEAFEGIATAKANAETNLQKARELFRSALEAALSGSLTTNGKNELSPAKGILPPLRGSNCDSGSPSWGSRDLESLLIAGRKISYGIVKPGRHDPEGVRLIKSQQVRDDSMDLSADFRITRALDEEYSRTRLKGGEILLNLVGASIGRSAIAPEELRGANVSRAIAVIPARREVSAWIQYNLRGPVGQRLIQSSTGGSAQPVLNLSEVRKLTIPFPTLGEQQAIVRSLDALSEETKRLGSLYERKVAALEALKKSLLHQAFTGNL